MTEPPETRPLISVVTPCFNEEGNIRELYSRIRAVFAAQDLYRYEHIFIDNASTDKTVSVLRDLARTDRNVKVIVNRRNFGHVRSPHYAVLLAQGDAIVALASDLQDPPELIPRFLEEWEAGHPVVLGVKEKSEESGWMRAIRSLYYRLLRSMSDVELISHATGFGLYDRKVVDLLRTIDDPYPYARGLLVEFGFEYALIPYTQGRRKSGRTKNNFYSLYDLAMLGITSYSKIPLRMATMSGFLLASLSLLAGLGYLLYKLIFWSRFSAGIAPVVIGLFLFASVQLFFLGIVGEYIAVIHTRLMKRPLVVERERINFEPPANSRLSGQEQTPPAPEN
jgi:glycosyltransferase involved in cell wall biosynthesis